MSKKYRGKPCVYCGGGALAETGDHIFARKFFLISDRRDLPKVPACNRCNSIKSQLELYATTILPLAGRHAAAIENLKVNVPPRLDRNPPLRRRIQESMTRIWVQENGVIQPTGTVAFDWDTIERLFQYIARGLHAFHFGTIVPVESEVIVEALNAEAEVLWHNEFFSAGASVLQKLGGDTVIYQGIRTSDHEQCSVWRFRMYGGAVMTSGTDVAQASAQHIGALLYPASMLAEAPSPLDSGRTA